MTALKERKSYSGIVTSVKMNKTVVVTTTETIRHKRYEKVMKRNTKFYAHDEKDECKLGDSVMIEETRPISKLKRWRVTNVKERD
jgi:small subunit ribosomal protein S17